MMGAGGAATLGGIGVGFGATTAAGTADADDFAGGRTVGLTTLLLDLGAWLAAVADASAEPVTEELGEAVAESVCDAAAGLEAVSLVGLRANGAADPPSKDTLALDEEAAIGVPAEVALGFAVHASSRTAALSARPRVVAIADLRVRRCWIVCTGVGAPRSGSRAQVCIGRTRSTPDDLGPFVGEPGGCCQPVKESRKFPAWGGPFERGPTAGLTTEP
jgi:hypothetical protein